MHSIQPKQVKPSNVGVNSSTNKSTTYRILKVGERSLHLTQNKRAAINVHKLISTKEEKNNVIKASNIRVRI